MQDARNTHPLPTTQQNEAALDEARLIAETGIAARVAHLIDPVLKQLGFRLVRARLLQQNGPVLQIMAERPDGTITIEDCEEISQAVSPELDVSDLITSEYRLEISSPGVDRPLVRVSDFARAIDHEARIELTQPLENGRKRFRGLIRALEGEGNDALLTLERTDARPDETTHVTLPLRHLDEAKLMLTEALIRQSLRAGKLQQTEHAQQTQTAEELERPRRGPGRFRTDAKTKAKPLTPAGIQTSFKKGGGPTKPRTANSEGE